MGHLLASASGVDLWAGPRSTLEDTRRAANSVHLKTILQEIRATGVDHPRVLVVERSPFTPEPLRCLSLHVLLPRDLTLSEPIMMKPRSWTVTRGWIPHPGAQRHWDRAYQAVLHMAAKHPDQIAIGTGTAHAQGEPPCRP